MMVFAHGGRCSFAAYHAGGELGCGELSIVLIPLGNDALCQLGNGLFEIAAAVQPTTAKVSSKGIPIMTRAQRSHPLDPLSAAEIAVAIATVRAAGKSPEERDGMRFVEVVLLEPEKNVVALADAYFFPPFQPSLPSWLEIPTSY